MKPRVSSGVAIVDDRILDAALSYVAQGFKVFPTKLDKKPFTDHGLKDATMLQDGVKDYWNKYPDAGIGLVTDGFIVLDFDRKGGGLDNKAVIESQYGQLPRTRTHRTGGGGLHYIYRNTNGTNIRNTVNLGGYQGVDLRANGGYIIAPPSKHESGNHYEVIDNSKIAPAPMWLIEMATKKTPMLPANTDNQLIPEGQRNSTLTSRAGTMRRSGMPESVIEAALLEVNRLQCQPPLLEDEVRTIAKSVTRYPPSPNGNVHVRIYECDNVPPDMKRDKNVTENVTLSDRVQAWVKGTSGWWPTEELDRELGITTTPDKDNRRQIIKRLKDEGVVEQHPNRNKQFRYVNTKVTELKFKTASNAGVMPIKWPLGIERYVNLFPGNMAVVAGSPDAGKTALLLNLIYLNQDEFPIHYFCSEMGDVELRSRLDKFPGMSTEDWCFKAVERASNFADVIVPDCVNIIDYLEMTTDLYMVNTYLTEISHKLGSGIAIVALQKKLDASIGRGQEFGLEKPKLYLSMDKGKMSIVKGKSWANKNLDPHGLIVKFQIEDGCVFKLIQDWHEGK
jgi:hypothetical protein